MAEAVEHGERALQMAREQGLTERVAYVLTDLSKAYFQIERVEDGRAALAEAGVLWRELGTLNMLADNLASVAGLQIGTGDYDQALANAGEAQQISRAIGNVWNESYSIFAVDVVYFERGNMGRAIEIAQECQRLAALAGFAEGLAQSAFDLALMFGYLGALPRAFEIAREAQALADARSGTAHSAPQIEGLIALLLLQAGRPDEGAGGLRRDPDRQRTG